MSVPGSTILSLVAPPAGIQFAHKAGTPALPRAYDRVQWPTGHNIGFASDSRGRWQYVTRPGDFWVQPPVEPHSHGQDSYLLFTTYLGPPESASEKKKSCCSACVLGQPCCDSSDEEKAPTAAAKKPTKKASQKQQHSKKSSDVDDIVSTLLAEAGRH